MLTEAQKRAKKAHHNKLVADGFKRVVVWLSPEEQTILAKLVKAFGTPTAAIRQAIKEAAK